MKKAMKKHNQVWVCLRTVIL